MESKEAQSCLKTFLEVSQIQIDMRTDSIKRKNALKKWLDSEHKSYVNREIHEITEERCRIQGRLDSVRLELLDMILDNPSLISPRLLAKKGCSSVTQFVKQEKETIELRGLYQENPCSIAEILNIGLSAKKPEVSFSMFEEPKLEATDRDVKNAVSEKVVKVMTKRM